MSAKPLTCKLHIPFSPKGAHHHDAIVQAVQIQLLEAVDEISEKDEEVWYTVNKESFHDDGTMLQFQSDLNKKQIMNVVGSAAYFVCAKLGVRRVWYSVGKDQYATK